MKTILSLSFALAAFAIAAESAATLPAQRAVTDSAGPKLEGTILSKDADSIQFRRTSDGKQFDLPLAKLSADDQTFIATPKTPTAALPPAGGPLKILFVVPPDAIYPAGARNLPTAAELGNNTEIRTRGKLDNETFIIMDEIAYRHNADGRGLYAQACMNDPKHAQHLVRTFHLLTSPILTQTYPTLLDLNNHATSPDPDRSFLKN